MNKFEVGDRVQLNLRDRTMLMEDDGAFGTVVDIDRKPYGGISYGIQLDVPLKEPSSFYSLLNQECTFFRCVDKWIVPAREEEIQEEIEIDISALV